MNPVTASAESSSQPEQIEDSLESERVEAAPESPGTEAVVDAPSAPYPGAQDVPEGESEAAEPAPTAEVDEAAPDPESTTAEPEPAAEAEVEQDAEVEPAAEVEPEVAAEVEPAAEVEADPTADAEETEPEPSAEPAQPEASAEPEPSAAEPEPTAEPAPASPSVVPGPRPRPVPESVRSGVVTVSVDTTAWGRVEDDGTVSVREGEQWRVVGQFPDGTPDEALAYFARKFQDLADKVLLLEQRQRAGGASASELRTAADHLQSEVTGAAAVGDLAALSSRLSALTGQLSEATAAEAAANREAVDAALAERTALVVRIEEIAARDPKSIQWKQTTAEVTALFEQWQAQQQNGPRLPRSAAQALWKRFRDARAVVDRHRREFYSELDEVHKAARDRKTRLIERAEALAPKGEQGIADYRTLLDQWKAAGRAGRKADDALWARFKAAGDALYSARAERDAAEAEASREKIAERQKLLEEARPIVDEPDVGRARQLLTSIQRRWDDVGRIFPRERERALDDELRKIEQTVRGREETDWRKNNPETKARANDMTRQLMDAIEKLENELAAAKKAGDARAQARAEEALAARKTWLQALGG